MADQGLVFTVDGKRLELNLDELSGRDAKEFRTQTGMALRSSVMMFVSKSGDVDIDTIAGIIWLARRQGGDQITYDKVLDEINYATDLDVDAGEVDSPEA